MKIKTLQKKYDVKPRKKQANFEGLPTGTSVIFHAIEQHADENILNQLSAVGDTLEQMAWKCGWLVEELYVNLQANNYEVDYLMVCYYVSVVRLRGQRSMNTVKKWALTARFFPPKVAAHYGAQVLPFSHFTYAASFDDEKDTNGGLLWAKVLTYSWDRYTDESGYARYATVAELEQEFEGKKPKKKTTPPTTNQFVPSVSTSEMPVIDIEDEDEQDNADEQKALSIITEAVSLFENTVRNALPRMSKRYPSVASGLAAILSLLGNLKSALKTIAVKSYDF